MTELEYLKFMQEHDVALASANQKISEAIITYVLFEKEKEQIISFINNLEDLINAVDLNVPAKYQEAHSLYVEAMKCLKSAINDTESKIKENDFTSFKEQFFFYIQKYNNLKNQAQEMIMDLI